MSKLTQQQVGSPGVRDLNEQDNCVDFDPEGAATRDCDSDGHYMCPRCRHCDLDQFDRLKD